MTEESKVSLLKLQRMPSISSYSTEKLHSNNNTYVSKQKNKALDSQETKNAAKKVTHNKTIQHAVTKELCNLAQHLNYRHRTDRGESTVIDH